MTFPFATSYFGCVTLEIMIKARGLTIEQIVSLCIFILFYLTSHCCLTMTGFQGMVGFDVSFDFIRRAGMVENHP